MKPRKKTRHLVNLPFRADASEAVVPPRVAGVDAERRLAMIAEAAYYRAESRGFEPGRELEDWCAAESDIDSSFPREPAATPCGP